jgi:hypothetical protein
MPCMPSAVLAPHADAIVRRLDDTDLHVRHAASEMLGKPPPPIGLQPLPRMAAASSAGRCEQASYQLLRATCRLPRSTYGSRYRQAVLRAMLSSMRPTTFLSTLHHLQASCLRRCSRSTRRPSWPTLRTRTRMCARPRSERASLLTAAGPLIGPLIGGSATRRGSPAVPDGACGLWAAPRARGAAQRGYGATVCAMVPPSALWCHRLRYGATVCAMVPPSALWCHRLRLPTLECSHLGHPGARQAATWRRDAAHLGRRAPAGG